MFARVTIEINSVTLKLSLKNGTMIKLLSDSLQFVHTEIKFARRISNGASQNFKNAVSWQNG